MSQHHIHFIVECSIADGKLEIFQDLAREISTLIQEKEPTTQTYQWYINREGTKCIIHEVYPDSESMLAHGRVKNFRILLGQLVKIAPITQFYILGDLTDEATKAMATVAGENKYKSFTGFTR
jgi:quinol monooxygenase YgiN